MSAAAAVVLLASGCSVRATAAAAAVLSSSSACCPSTFAAVSVMLFAVSAWLRLHLCHQLAACVAMLCIFCAALLAAALICVAKLAAGSGELGCCNGTCASAAISCTASVAMCCRYIGVFAVAPLHSSVYCGAATASAATAFPLLISVISSAAAVRDCRWHCALARYTFSALCARALAVDRRTPSSSKTPTPSSMVSSWLASASATARVYLCSASASRDAAASALPADGSVSCKAAVVARWRGAPSGAFAAGGGALPPWAASLATRDRSPTCVESWQRAPRPGGAGCRSCAPLAVGCSEGRSGGAGQHRCYVVYEGSFHRSLIARPRVVFESLVLEQSMLYDSTMI